MRPIWLYAIGAALLVGLGFYASQERTARIEADKRVAAWKDSVQRVSLRAAAAEHLFDSTKAAYYKQKPAVVQLTKWKSRVDTVATSIEVHGDTTDAVIVQAIFDSVTTDCAKRDSLARAAMEAATVALAVKDSALTLATHPPPVSPQKRVGFFAQGAWDVMQHQVALQGGVELRLHGDVTPFVSVGAEVGPSQLQRAVIDARNTYLPTLALPAMVTQTTAHLYLGVRKTW